MTLKQEMNVTQSLKHSMHEEDADRSQQGQTNKDGPMKKSSLKVKPQIEINAENFISEKFIQKQSPNYEGINSSRGRKSLSGLAVSGGGPPGNTIRRRGKREKSTFLNMAHLDEYKKNAKNRPSAMDRTGSVLSLQLNSIFNDSLIFNVSEKIEVKTCCSLFFFQNKRKELNFEAYFSSF